MKNEKFRSLVLATLAVFTVGARIGFSETADAVTERGASFSITDENDAWSNPFGPHQDRHYTHGIKLAYIGSDEAMTNLTSRLNRLFSFGDCWGRQPLPGNLGLVVGQDMYTPENILDPNPILTDRPYAGWLYGGLVYERRHEHSRHFATLESFEVNIGIVGPESMADDTQTLIHRWRFPEDIPQGWKNQIQDEPGGVLKYAALWRYSPTDGTARFFDVIPRVGAEAGNVVVFGTVGVTARLGINLPPDFGKQIIDSPASENGGINGAMPWFAAYGFAGVDGRCVLHDITLDGNTVGNSQTVRKYNFVNDLSWGIAINLGRHFEVSWAQITRSKEFVGQVQKDVFGSIDLKYEFSF